MNKIRNKAVNFWKNFESPEYLMIGVIVFLLISMSAFYLIDLRNVFGLRDALFELKPVYFYYTYYPFFFQHWGRNSGAAEIFQWLFLAISVLMAAFVSGRIKPGNKNLIKFWGLMSLAFVFMILEDAGDLRHTFMSYIQVIFDEPDQGWGGTSFELLYFAFLGGLPLYALMRYGWKELADFGRTRIYVITGFVFYFLASSLSFFGTALSGLLDKDLYTLAGEKFYLLCLKIGDAGLAERWEAWESVNWQLPIGFFLMDSLLEESLELIGASAFAIALMLFWRAGKQKSIIP
jgi:hypothetical protein